ncbi:MAG: hypothetical protein ACSW8F_00175 [bacterium]
MSLFPRYDTPGPGVQPDEPRKRGLARIWELLSREFNQFWLSGILNLLSALPFFLVLSLARVTHSLLLALLAGALGGLIAAPGFLGLADTLLRGLRDEPGFWWMRYRRAIQRGWRVSLPLGALFGTVFALQLFTLHHMYLVGGGLGLFLCQVLSMLVSTGLFLWALPQAALLELSFPALLKNSLLLSLRYLPRTLAGAALCLLYALAAYLTFPASAIALLIFGLWLPLLCALQCIYPALDSALSIEARLGEHK